jgi:hypothetical protein
MRGTLLPLLPFAAWLGALQSLPWNPGGAEDTTRIVGVASVLASLTVLVYRLGVWRQEMENMRNNVGAEVKGYREETTANFDRLERRLEAIDHLIARASEHQVRTARWQARTTRRIERLEAGGAR